jgi:hypothetical protein
VPTGIDSDAISALARRVQERTGVGSGHVGGFGSLDRFLEISRSGSERRTD